MVSIPEEKVYNAYIIETYNYEGVKDSIKRFAVANGFDSSLVYSDTHPDIKYIESVDKIIPIKTIREAVIVPAIYSPKIAKRKFYIIYDAINLDEITQNALLKTLEEPPQFDSFFLVTSNVNNLFETIRSRCIIIKDNDELSYDDILKLDYVNDAVTVLANIKYESAGDKMALASLFDGKDKSLRPLIRLYRCVLRDALLYKKTLAKNMFVLKELESSIISIANSFTMEELGKLVDNLDVLSDASKYNYVNKRIALYNFFEV